jgi:hypothetical protein
MNCHAGHTEVFRNCAAAGLYGDVWKSGDDVYK